MMKNALLIALYFPPRRRVGALRPFKFAIHLRKFGWQPTVVTLASHGELTPKEKLLLRDVDVISMRSPIDRTRHAESQLDNRVRGLRRFRFLPKLDMIDRCMPVDSWLPLLAVRYARVAEIVQDLRPDVIWSTADPWSSHVLAMWLAGRFRNPWVADFRDPWTLCELRTADRPSFVLALDRHFERKILTNADVVTFTAKETEHTYHAAYSVPNFVSQTIYNSFDSTLVERPTSSLLSSEKSTLNICFFGRFRELSPATIIIDILASVLVRHGTTAAQRIRVFSFGPLSENDRLHAACMGVEECFRQCDPVPPGGSSHVLNQFDILLLSTDARRDTIIPAKLWDYLAADKPILSVSRNPEVREILELTGAGLQMDTGDPGFAGDFLLDCLIAKGKGHALPIASKRVPAILERFTAVATTKSLAGVFNKLVSHAG